MNAQAQFLDGLLPAWERFNDAQAGKQEARVSFGQFVLRVLSSNNKGIVDRQFLEAELVNAYETGASVRRGQFSEPVSVFAAGFAERRLIEIAKERPWTA